MYRIGAVLSVLMYCATVTYSWSTLKAVLVNHTEKFDTEFIYYNITPTKSGTHDVYINVRKNNMKLFTKIVVDFETNPDEYGTQFMNRTFDTCKFYNTNRFEPLIHVFYNAIVDKPSVFLPKRCPIKTGVYHYLNASIQTDKIPPISSGTKAARIYLKYSFLENSVKLKPILWLKFYFKLQRK